MSMHVSYPSMIINFSVLEGYEFDTPRHRSFALLGKLDIYLSTPVVYYFIRPESVRETLQPGLGRSPSFCDVQGTWHMLSAYLLMLVFIFWNSTSARPSLLLVGYSSFICASIILTSLFERRVILLPRLCSFELNGHFGVSFTCTSPLTYVWSTHSLRKKIVLIL